MAVTQYNTNIITCTAAGDSVLTEMFIWRVIWYGAAIVNGDDFQIANNEAVPQILANEASDTQENSNVIIVLKHSKTGFQIVAMTHGFCDVYCTQIPYSLGTKIPVALDYTQ